jgi:hypothetical protein
VTERTTYTDRARQACRCEFCRNEGLVDRPLKVEQQASALRLAEEALDRCIDQMGPETDGAVYSQAEAALTAVRETLGK